MSVQNIVTYGRAALLVVGYNEKALLHLMVRKSYGQVSPSLFFEDVYDIIQRKVKRIFVLSLFDGNQPN